MFLPKSANKTISASLVTLAVLLAPTVPSWAQTEPAPAAETTPKPAPQRRVAIDIPVIELDNSSVDEATLRQILSDRFPDYALELSTLNANKITIPTIKLTAPGQTKKAVPTTIEFTNILLDKVTNGTVASFSVDKVTVAERDLSASINDVKFTDLSFANIARVLDKSLPAEPDFYPIYNAISTGPSTFGGLDFGCSFKSSQASNYSVRPFGHLLAKLPQDFFERFGDADYIEQHLSPLARFYAQALGSFESGPSGISNISCADVKTAGSARSNSMTIASIDIDGTAPATYPRITVNDVKFSADDVQLNLKDFTFKGGDFSNMIKALEESPEPLTMAYLEENYASLSPNFAGFGFTDLAITFDADTDEPRQFKTGTLDLDLAEYRNSLPGSINFLADNISFAVPEDDDDALFEIMRLGGIDVLNGNINIAGRWNSADETISFPEASVSIANIGTLRLDALLSQATELLFDPDFRVASEAVEAIALNTFNMTVEDQGIGKIVLTMLGSEMGTDADVETMRPIYADLAKGTVISFMADLANAAELGDAVSAFVAGTAKTLNIGVKAKSEAGINLDAFIAAEDDPSSLLKKVDVTATAE